jgi:hypothetical protein
MTASAGDKTVAAADTDADVAMLCGGWLVAVSQCNDFVVLTARKIFSILSPLRFDRSDVL